MPKLVLKSTRKTASKPARTASEGRSIQNPDEPASPRQTWALHVISRDLGRSTDFRPIKMTKAEASDLIGTVGNRNKSATERVAALEAWLEERGVEVVKPPAVLLAEAVLADKNAPKLWRNLAHKVVGA